MTPQSTGPAELQDRDGHSGSWEHESGHHGEGRVARTIERQTAKLPSDTFLWGAGAAVAGSILLHMSGRKQDAIFVGHWAPTLLCLGLYNKVVKTQGHDDVE